MQPIPQCLIGNYLFDVSPCILPLGDADPLPLVAISAEHQQAQKSDSGTGGEGDVQPRDLGSLRTGRVQRSRRRSTPTSRVQDSPASASTAYSIRGRR